LRTLDSVNWQRFPATEIIVVDDGSSDEGPLLVEQAAIKNLTLIRQSNQGVSAARNTGIAAAKCEYIAFLDADDEWLPLYLDEIAGLIKRFPATAMYACRYQIVEAGNNYVDAKIHMAAVDPSGILLHDFFQIASLGNLPFMISSAVVKNSLLKEIGGFPEGEAMGEDQDLICRAALSGSIAYSPNIHLLYHCDAQNQASKHNIPDSECAFSKRVSAIAKDAKTDKQQAVDMLRFSAAHLCHLAKLNISKRRYEVARALLADPRCRLKPKHLVGLYYMSWVRQIYFSLLQFISKGAPTRVNP
jgi:glycosyltransferase involved in cell wall biosynthesis